MARKNNLRSDEMMMRYEEHRRTGALEHSCPLCDADAIQKFAHWKIIPNRFPYDLIAETHHMIVPLRHTAELELTEEEVEEFRKIKYEELQEYDILIEATKHTKSIPAHYHLHLITLKTPDSQGVSSMLAKLIEHGWKWAIVGLLALIVLPFVLVTAHNLESGRERDDSRQELPRD